jgi:Icc-related predicted phosphoesterase
MRRRGRARATRRTRLFFATDIHGSSECFRKWIASWRAYEIDTVILGGDITGKALVPFVRSGRRWVGELWGQPMEASSPEDFAQVKRLTQRRGQYPIEVTEEEKRSLDEDPAAVDALFAKATQERLAEWLELADARLKGTGIASYVMLGNDDEPALAEILRGSEALVYAEDGVHELPNGLELISWGYSPPTPWNTPREAGEDEIATAVEERASSLRDPSRAIFNLHAPPYETHLDQAPKLDEELRPVVGPVGIEAISAGSHAVRAAIERYQPLVGLHGHVHESGGVQDLGSTVCINPGSVYAEGLLRGAIVDIDIDKARVRSWQLTEG